MSFIWQNLAFFAPVLLVSAALALAGGTGGVLVILRRQTLLALALPQIVTLGAAVGLRLGWPTLPPAIGCLLIAMGLIAWSSKSGSTHLLLPALYVAGLCLSILIVANAGAELIHVQNLFVGIDVAVGVGESIGASVVLILVTGVICLLWRRWLLLAQAPAAAELARLRPARWDALFLGLICTILVVGTDTLGAAMAVVMLFLPAATVLPWARRVPGAMWMSAAAGVVFLLVGFVVSIEMEWPLSQTVGGVGFAAFLCSFVLAKFR